jgi:hypothetical protein
VFLILIHLQFCLFYYSNFIILNLVHNKICFGGIGETCKIVKNNCKDTSISHLFITVFGMSAAFANSIQKSREGCLAYALKLHLECGIREYHNKEGVLCLNVGRFHNTP